MGKPKAPAAPSYAPIIAAQSQAAINSQNLANQQFNRFSQQADADRAITNSAIDATSKQSAQNAGQSALDIGRYNSTYVPAENEYLQNAQSYTDPAQVSARAASAAGDVTQQFDVARDNARRQLEAYGVDPTQTRAAALDLSTRTQEAAARASAMNVSRRQDALTGQQMLGTAIGQGQTDAARGLQESQLASSQAAQGAGLGLAATASEANTLGTTPQYTQIANSSLSGAANTTNQQYQNQLDEYKANQASSSGLGSLLGTVAGFGLKSYDSGGKIGNAIAGLFADGGAVPDDIHEGISVDRNLSPSGGAQTDDVPARLNAGEFVLPADYVRWVGERSLQRDIAKSKQERQQAGARPRVQALPVERPTIDTGALQVRR